MPARLDGTVFHCTCESGAVGETVYIAGGAGHVGRAVIELAVRAGARVVASAGAADLDHCRALGADSAVDYRADDFAEQLQRTVGDGVNVHLNTSGQHDLDLAATVLASRSRLIAMSGISARPELPTGRFYTGDRRVLGFAISNARTVELADGGVADQPTARCRGARTS